MSPSRALLLLATVFSAAVVAVGFEVLKPRVVEPIPDLPRDAQPPQPRLLRGAEPTAPRPVAPAAEAPPAAASPASALGSAPVQAEVGNEYDSLDEITEGNYDQRPLPRVHRPRRPPPEALKHILEED